LLKIKNKYSNDIQKVHEEAMVECSFLFTYYTDIYNKIRKDEINLSILNRFLNVLRLIEDGEADQHEASFMVGTLLKELYVDSALRKADKLNKDETPKEQTVKPIQISWKQFKNR
jgi:hypothetical protein